MFSMTQDTLLFDQIDEWMEREENEKVKLILEHTLPTDLNNKNGVTMLHIAASHGNLQMMEYLISKGYEIDAKDISNYTPLSMAIYCEQWTAAKYLLEQNADIFAKDLDDGTPLSMLMCVDTPYTEVLQMFIDRIKSECADKQEFVAKLIEYDCPLNKIVHLHDAEITEIFLNTPGADSLETNMVGSSVYIALSSMDEENLWMLLHRGEKSERRKADFVCCLHSLMFNNTLDDSLAEASRLAIQKLVEWKLLSPTNKFSLALIFQDLPANYIRIMLDETLLKYANSVIGYDIRISMFGNRNPCVLQMIQENIVDINILGSNDETALHEATAYSAVDTMIYLLDCGMNPDIRDKDNKTPIFHVNYLGTDSMKCLAILLQCGADLQATDVHGNTFINYIHRSSSGMPELRPELMIIIISHLAIIQVSGTPVDKSFRDRILSMNFSHGYFHSCCLKLEEMKNYNVHSTLTLFDALIRNMENLIMCVNSLDHETIDNFYKNSGIRNFENYYIKLSRLRLYRAVTIKRLREKAIAVLSENIHVLKPYYLVIKQICSCLSYYDLRVFE